MNGKSGNVKGRRCPECGSDEVRRSHMRGVFERGILRLIGVRAFRCDSCDHRHFAFERALERDAEKRRAEAIAEKGN